MIRKFTAAQIEAAPEWMAEEMLLLNEIMYCLKSARQFLNLAFMSIGVGIIIQITAGSIRQLLLAAATYLLGMISNIVAYRYNRKAKKVLKSTRWNIEDAD